MNGNHKKQDERPSADEFLSVENLVVEYTSDGQTVHAVNGVSFHLERGRTIGLVGETGAGKTTIAKTILRILPDKAARVKSGNIMLEGKNLLELPEAEMRRIRGNNISMIFQDPMTALNPVMKVGRQISEVIKIHNHISQNEADKRAVEMLEMVGIPEERFEEYPHQFSGGMKQRVVIAIALACNPDLLLADEPTTALDVTIQAQVLDMIKELKEQYHTAMILITHDLGVVANTCDDVAVIYAGEIVEMGTVRQIFKNPSHPYTIGLFGALPDMNEDEEWLHPIDGLPPDPCRLPDGCLFGPRCPYKTADCEKGEIAYETVEDGHICKCCHGKEVRRERK